jgi:hypothetical protein
MSVRRVVAGVEDGDTGKVRVHVVRHGRVGVEDVRDRLEDGDLGGALDHQHGAGENGLGELAPVVAVFLELEPVRQQDWSAGQRAAVVAGEDDYPVRIELLDHVRRVRGDDDLAHPADHEVDQPALGVRWQSDLRLLHREDHRLVALQLGDVGEQGEHQKVQRPGAETVERHAVRSRLRRQEQP